MASLITLGCGVFKFRNLSLTGIAFDLEDALKVPEVEGIDRETYTGTERRIAKTEKLMGKPKASSVVENKDVINRIL